MIRSLLDVNVLIALFDTTQPHHASAHMWFKECDAWATCPITLNGCIRILSRPDYPAEGVSASRIAGMLGALCTRPSHEFWPDDISPLDESIFDLTQIQGHRQLTDVYLLALAVRHGGQLVTFDRSIPWRAVRGAKASHLKLLGGPVR